MNWSVKKRLEFLERRLLWDKKISRRDLVDFFAISIPQATKDLKQYQEQAPTNLYYDKSKKHYVAAEDFAPVFVSPKSDSYFSQLASALAGKVKSIFSCGTMPPAYMLPIPARQIDESILKSILGSLHSCTSICIMYQSMNTDVPVKQWISPHAFGFDGQRWHVRSLSHKNKVYGDFHLGRILSVEGTNDVTVDHANDFLWHNTITLRIAPHPGLTPSQKACIERDYEMINEIAEVEIKAAFHFYLKERLKLTSGHKKRPGKEQQIILTNEEEIETQIKLLKSIEKNRLESVRLLA